MYAQLTLRRSEIVTVSVVTRSLRRYSPVTPRYTQVYRVTHQYSKSDVGIRAAGQVTRDPRPALQDQGYTIACCDTDMRLLTVLQTKDILEVSFFWKIC